MYLQALIRLLEYFITIYLQRIRLKMCNLQTSSSFFKNNIYCNKFTNIQLYALDVDIDNSKTEQLQETRGNKGQQQYKTKRIMSVVNSNKCKQFIEFISH